MPKVEIDYSNTIFYKIFCKDPTIKELYVGLTTNFVQRRHAHKQSCKNEKATNHNCKLYNNIRNAGGWDNWQMEIIAFHNCADSYEARKKEQEYFEKLGATLNSIDPLPKPKIKEHVAKIVTEKPKLFCEPCKVYFSHWKTRDAHNNTKKHHKMVSIHSPNKIELNNLPEPCFKYNCKTCNFSTYKKTNYNLHIKTKKHISNSLSALSNTKNDKTNFQCNKCNKIYNDRSGLWRHKQSCMDDKSHEEENVIKPKGDHSDDDLIMMLINDNKALRNLLVEQSKENTECKNMMMEVIKNGTIQYK